MRTRTVILIIVAVDGVPVTTRDEMLHEFEMAGPGAGVTLTVLRDGGERQVKLSLVPLD